MVNNVEAGETTGGGSTLTQQYVKLVLLDQAETAEERAAVLADSGPEGYMRKLRELRMALNLERELTKDEILERYLNIANFGGPPGRTNYGVEAAARFYFSTSAADLDLVQAATLAGLVQRPTAYEPTRNPEAAIGRRNTVITRMETEGMITPEEAAEARQSDLGLEITETRSGCVSSWAPWFCDYVINYREQDFASQVKEITRGEGCHVVYDGVGKATFPASLDCLRPFGYFVSFGTASVL
jgi:membrane peptidoglycan carboxypeptidase